MLKNVNPLLVLKFNGRLPSQAISLYELWKLVEFVAPDWLEQSIFGLEPNVLPLYYRAIMYSAEVISTMSYISAEL